MIRLLRANMGRLKKETAFWAAIIFMVFYALCVCLMAKYSMDLNDNSLPLDGLFLYGYGLTGLIAVPGLVMAAVCSLFVGTEYSDGTIRNKLIVGHSRAGIYLSNFITCAAVGIALNLSYALVVCAVGIPLCGWFTASAGTILSLIADGVLMLISYAAIFTMAGMLMQNKTLASIFCILGVVVSMFLSFYLGTCIAQPEMIDTLQIIDGEQVMKSMSNPRYLSQTVRNIYQFIIDFLPSGQSVQISGQTAPHLGLMAMYSLVIIICSNIIGIFVFRKKDIQ